MLLHDCSRKGAKQRWHRSLRKYDKALDAINKAIQMNPDPHYYLNRSYAQFGLNISKKQKRMHCRLKKKGS
jgi:hypothetical protein